MKLSARFIFVAVLVVDSLAANEQFLRATNTECACPGELLTFTCVTVGTRSGATIWTGSAFNCSGNEITLLHEKYFQSGGTSDGCINEPINIVGKSISVVNEMCFTSELNVTVSNALNFTTVICFLDSQMQQPVGMAVITLADACSEVEPKVNLIKVDRGELTFSWSPLASNCPTVQYRITFDCTCGNCPNHTTNTSTTCAITLSSTERNCTFSVTGELHGFAGRPSSPITVTLKVPDEPEVNLLPVYSHNNTLIRLIFEIKQMDFFSIYDGIPGSVENYTVNISSDASSLISVTTIPANISKCSGKICEYELKVSPEIATICPSSSEFDDNTIMISVLAENMLGPGLPTDMIPIECINRFVTVNISQANSTLTCLFLGNQSSIERMCSVEYRICGEEHTFTEKGNSTLNMVTLKFSLASGSDCYTYTVKATDGAHTIAVMGMVDSRTDEGGSSSVHDIVLIAVPIAISIIILSAVVLVSLVVFYCYKRFKGCTAEKGTPVDPPHPTSGCNADQGTPVDPPQKK